MNDWIVDNLNSAFGTWNNNLTELWALATETPQNFKGGAVWGVILAIHNGMIAVGYALVVLFFLISLFKSVGSFRELRRMEAVFPYFIRFLVAKAAVGYGMEIMLRVFEVCNGIVLQMAGSMGGITVAAVTLPTSIEAEIRNLSFLASIPLWMITLLGSLIITVLSFVMIMTVYFRFFRLYMYTALAPIPLSAVAGQSTQSVGISFLKSYIGVCMEGAIVVLACVIYAGFAAAPQPAVGNATAVVWAYLAEVIFNMLVLVGLIRGSDRVIHEMMGL